MEDWTPADLQKVNKHYHPFIERNLINLVHEKIIAYKEIFPCSKYIALIVVPVSLRRKIFPTTILDPAGNTWEYIKLPSAFASVLHGPSSVITYANG